MTNALLMSSAALGALALAAVGCGNDGMMNGPGMTGPGMTGPSVVTGLVSVSPAGGVSGVTTSSAVHVRFSHAMGDGMVQFVDLHEGDMTGRVVPTTNVWSSDRTTLTCTPAAPLMSQTRYTLHVGGGMWDADGSPIDMEPVGFQMGGVWAGQTMMGGSHAGMPLGMMGSGWRHSSNGSFGMVFSFVTE